MRGHVCSHLFFLDMADYVDDEGPDNDTAAAPEVPIEQAVAQVLVVSVYALAGIRTYHTMLLQVVVNGERLLGLLDMGSTHTFLQGAVMRRLGLTPHGAD